MSDKIIKYLINQLKVKKELIKYSSKTLNNSPKKHVYY